MEDETACEVWANKSWEAIGITLALKMPNTRRKRCPECHGRVRSHAEANNGMRAHMEHYKAHSGCSRSVSFDGTASPHPEVMT
jgi:hypothetical protein